MNDLRSKVADYMSTLLECDLTGCKSRYTDKLWDKIQCYAAKFPFGDALGRLRYISCQTRSDGALDTSCTCISCRLCRWLESDFCFFGPSGGSLGCVLWPAACSKP